jgi:hypothetical protein
MYRLQLLILVFRVAEAPAAVQAPSLAAPMVQMVQLHLHQQPQVYSVVVVVVAMATVTLEATVAVVLLGLSGEAVDLTHLLM